MKELIKMVVVLTMFCLASGLILAWTNKATLAPIEKARKAELGDALKRVLPTCDNDVLADAIIIKENSVDWTFYVGRNKGAFVGAAFKSSSFRGYGGEIQVLVGLLPDGNVNLVEILLAAKETPGLGTKVKEPKFRDQFKGRSATDTKWAKVTKDGGEIQGITGATISSRAVTEAVKAGLDVFVKHVSEIAGSMAEK